MKKSEETKKSSHGKCAYRSENGMLCMRPKSTRQTPDQNPEGWCTYHLENSACEKKSDAEPSDTFNNVCAICIEEGETEESGKLYPLVCTHRFHTNCLMGLTKAECPMCRQAAINLPASIKSQIDENAKKYRQETEEQEERELAEMLENEGMMFQPVRLPPQMEVILALKYLVQLGIPVSMIPMDTVLELDPQSPLPDPGSIFQNTVKRLIETIQERTSISAVEEDGTPISEDEEEIILDDDEDPFEFEGQDLQIVHRVRTIPLRSETGAFPFVAQALRALFSTMSFQIANLPDITQEDLINLRMGREREDSSDESF